MAVWVVPTPCPSTIVMVNMEVSTANWIVEQLQKVIERKYDRITWAVLGPVIFTLYTTPKQRLFRRHGVHYHKYADDIQLYESYNPAVLGDQAETVRQLTDCMLYDHWS